MSTNYERRAMGLLKAIGILAVIAFYAYVMGLIVGGIVQLVARD